MTDQDPRRIVFEYARSRDFRLIYANGAQGGVTPRGELLFDLFVEQQRAVLRTAHSVVPDGLGPEEVELAPNHLREVQARVVMSLQQAKSLGRWLLTTVEAFENARSHPHS